MSSLRTMLSVGVCVFVCCVGELSAQRPSVRCDQLTAALDGAAGSPSYRAALERIHLCPAEAAARIVAAWNHEATDSTDLAALRTAAVGFRDQRAADQLLAVAGNERFGHPMRLTALEALATYYRKCIVVQLVVHDFGEHGTQVAVLSGVMPYDGTVTGPRPPSAGMATRVLAAIDGLALQAGDPVVTNAAQRLSAALKRVGSEASTC